MKKAHVQELRSSVDASRARLGLPAIPWVYPIVSGAPVRAIDLEQIRASFD